MAPHNKGRRYNITSAQYSVTVLHSCLTDRAVLPLSHRAVKTGLRSSSHNPQWASSRQKLAAGDGDEGDPEGEGLLLLPEDSGDHDRGR